MNQADKKLLHQDILYRDWEKLVIQVLDVNSYNEGESPTFEKIETIENDCVTTSDSDLYFGCENIYWKPVLNPIRDINNFTLIIAMRETSYTGILRVADMLPYIEHGGTDLLPMCIYKNLMDKNYDLNGLIPKKLAFDSTLLKSNPYPR